MFSVPFNKVFTVLTTWKLYDNSIAYICLPSGKRSLGPAKHLILDSLGLEYSAIKKDDCTVGWVLFKSHIKRYSC